MKKLRNSMIQELFFALRSEFAYKNQFVTVRVEQ